METGSGFLDRFLGSEVEVHYAGGGGSYRDQGRFVGCRDGWVELDKGGADSFLIPVTAIRLMKVLGAAADPGGGLLRPVDAEPVDAARGRHLLEQEEPAEQSISGGDGDLG